MHARKALKLFVTVVLASGLQAAAVAQTPGRPIRLLVPYAPGAATDFNSRAVAGRMTEAMKQQVIVDNRPGANGMIATGMMVKAAPDGNTIMVVDIAHGANPALYADMPYDTQRDIAPVGMLARVPMVLLVHPAQPFKTVQDLVTWCKANAGKLNYGSAGTGSAMFLVTELFKSAAAIDVMQIAYKGGGPALVDLIGGQLPMAFISVVAGMPLAKSGRARVLGVSSLKRYHTIPEVPTIAESGVPGFEFALWQAMLAPAGVSRATLTRLNSELNGALNDPQVRERLTQAGNELLGGTPQQARDFIRDDIARWKKIIKPEMRVKR